MANATTPSPPSASSAATHQRPAANERPATHQRDIPAARRVTVVERATELSDEVLESLEAGQRAAIDAAGRFVVTLAEALPQEVPRTSEVAKTITESGLEMADRLSQTWYDLLRTVVHSAGKQLSGRNGAHLRAAR